MSRVIVRDEAIGAGETRTFYVPGAFFMLLEATSDVDIDVLAAEASIGRAEGVGVGFYFDFQGGQRFQGVRITSATAQTLKLCFSDGEAGVRGGAVTLSGTAETASAPQAYAQAAASVDVTSAQLLAAKTDRRFLLIQNKHASKNIWLNLAGAAATTANGVKLAPGGSLLIDQAAPSGAIFAIGETGVNTDVVVVEG